MQRSFTLVMLGLLLAGPCLAAEKVFLMTPADPKVQYPRFHVGASGIYATIEKGLAVTVDRTEPDTPAVGKFQKGDILLKVNGKPISEPEPYIVLGERPVRQARLLTTRVGLAITLSVLSIVRDNLSECF